MHAEQHVKEERRGSARRGGGCKALQRRNPASASLMPPSDRGLAPSEAAVPETCPRGGWLRAAHGELSLVGARGQDRPHSVQSCYKGGVQGAVGPGEAPATPAQDSGGLPAGTSSCGWRLLRPARPQAVGPWPLFSAEAEAVASGAAPGWSFLPGTIRPGLPSLLAALVPRHPRPHSGCRAGHCGCGHLGIRHFGQIQ